MASGSSSEVGARTAGPSVRPDVFMSYAREDAAFVERRLSAALVERGKDIWIDVEDIRGGASDWRANVWAGIEAAKVMVFVLTPDSVSSSVCGEELRRAIELNKRIIPVLHRSVEGLELDPALERPNWIYAREEDDFEASVTALVDALELDEAWVEQHARYTQRTSEWLRHDRDRSFLLSGSDLRAAERWLDDQGGHREAPTADQVTYITAGRRAAARRAQLLLSGVAVALVATTALAIIAYVAQQKAEERERIARSQARAAQAIATLPTNPERSVQRALEAVRIRSSVREAQDALRRAVAQVRWTSLLRTGDDAAPVLDAEFAPDGRTVATGARDGSVAIWNPRTGHARKLSGHREAVNTAVFSPDSRHLVTASNDGTARTWDASSGRPQHVLETKSDGVWAAMYGGGGRLIATVSERGGQIWDAASGTEVARLPSQREGAERGTIRLSPDGRRALTPGRTVGEAVLWDVPDERPIKRLRGDGGGELYLTLISADSRRILTIDDRGAATVWAARNGRRIADLPRRRGRLSDVDFSADGRWVVAAYADGRAEVRSVATRRRSRLVRNGEALSSAQFSPDGRYVVTGDEKGVARVWSVAGSEQPTVLSGHVAAIRRARFSADSATVVTASDDGSARLWPAHPGTPADPSWQQASSTTFAPDSRHVLVIDRARRGVWDTQTGRVVNLRGGIDRLIFGDEWPCGRAAGCSPWSADSTLVAGADRHHRAVVWNARTGDVHPAPGTRSRDAIGAALSPDGRHLVIVDGAARVAQVRNMRTGKLAATVPKRPGDVLVGAQFVADPLRVLTVDASNVAQLSGVTSGSGVMLSHKARPISVAARDDGRQVAVGTLDGKLRAYSGAPLSPRPRTRHAHAGAVSSVTFDRAGDAIATGGLDGTTLIWNAQTLARTALPAPGGAISGATFSPDGRFVLVTARSATRLWDRELERTVLELPETADARAEFSPDGNQIVLAGTSRLEVHRCHACAPLEELVRRARLLLTRP